ncbi:MAG: hypothetical protein ACRD0I_10690 [Acidimicrobiales bacterium]
MGQAIDTVPAGPVEVIGVQEFPGPIDRVFHWLGMVAASTAMHRADARQVKAAIG